MAKRATEDGDLLKSSHAVGLVNHPNHDQLGSMITEAVDKAVVAAMQRHGPQVPRQSQKGKGADRNQQKNMVLSLLPIQRIILEGGDHNPIGGNITLPGTPRSHQKPHTHGKSY